MRRFTVLALAVAAGCDASQGEQIPDDVTAPTVRITSPDRGTQTSGDVTVTGIASDYESGIDELLVNGVAVEVIDGQFTATVSTQPGTNLIRAVATNGAGVKAETARSVMSGADSALGEGIPEAMVALVSADALAEIGDQLGEFLGHGDLQSYFEGSYVYETGYSGPADCLYARVEMQQLDVGRATVVLEPASNRLVFEATLDLVNAQVGIDYAAACISGWDPGSFWADRIDIRGDVVPETTPWGVMPTLTNTQIWLDGVQLEVPLVPQSVEDLLASDAVINAAAGYLFSNVVPDYLAEAFASMNQTSAITVMDTEIQYAIYPDAIDIDPTGMRVSLTALTDVEGADDARYVHTDDASMPTAVPSGAFAVGVADDVLNQVLAGFWAAGGMTYSVPYEAQYDALGIIFDRIDLEAKLPPFVAMTGGKAEIRVGDLMISFISNDAPITRLAVNATISFSATIDAETGIKLKMDRPEIVIDIEDEGIEGANALDSERFEAILEFAAQQLGSTVGDLVGALPMPFLAGVPLEDTAAVGAGGYFRVEGRVVR